MAITRSSRIGYIDFDGHMRTVQYAVTDMLKTWIVEWSNIFDPQNFKIDMKWENDIQYNGYKLRVYVNNWVSRYIVDRSLFNHIQKDVEYLKYIGQEALRCSQCGIIMGWLEDLYKNTEDEYDLAKMWREDLSHLVREAQFQRTPSLGERAEPYDLVHLILHDYPTPMTLTIKEVMDEPKLLLARLSIMKR